MTHYALYVLSRCVCFKILSCSSSTLLYASSSIDCGASCSSCTYACALDKDREKRWREQKKKKETALEFSMDIWVRLTERTGLEAGPSPSAPKMTHDCFDFCHPLSPSAPKTKPPTNTEASTDTHTQRHTQSHTVYCLDYIIFIPGTWALLVGWHLGLCSTKVTFLCPWVRDACLQHAFEMKDGEKIRWERFPKALWSEASTVTHKLVKQYVNLGWYWIKLPEWHESIVLRWSK